MLNVRPTWSALVFAVVSASCASACSSSSSPANSDDQYSAAAVTGMHDSLLTDIQSLYQAAVDLQNAAPLPPDRGWDATKDADAITAMKTAWIRARQAYEHAEGALAPIFPDIDNSIDSRYDDFLTQLIGSGGDPYLFDDKGVTGLHAVERILYVDTTPARVVTFEKTLPGYVAASFPTTAAEAADFKNKLCAKVITDAGTLRDQWTPAKVNVAIAFQGLISLMNEQKEKVTKASTGEEESRYSQRTMADLRDNLDGTTAVYGVFKTWITSKTNAADATKDGKTIDGKISSGFQTLSTDYATVTGDAIPEPPSTWSAESPSPADLQTPFGQLYSAVRAAVDPGTAGGIVFEMNGAATILGFPTFQQQ